MSRIECFLLTETPNVRRSLRRFTWSKGNPCPGPYGGHNACVVIVNSLEKPRPAGEFESAPPLDLVPRDDPRWPVQCAHCDYRFSPDDAWQINDDRLYVNEDRGIVTSIRHDEAPVGAMYLAWWMTNHGSRFWRERGGGPHLYVVTPGGEWDVDQQSQNGEGWERTGEPPQVTANPSIHIPGRYHGWLRDGFLIEC